MYGKKQNAYKPKAGLVMMRNSRRTLTEIQSKAEQLVQQNSDFGRLIYLFCWFPHAVNWDNKLTRKIGTLSLPAPNQTTTTTVC